jgi:hypothetical protein
MTFKKSREKGESFRVDRYRCIEGRGCLYEITASGPGMSAKPKVTKTKTALRLTGKLKQETYNLT